MTTPATDASPSLTAHLARLARRRGSAVPADLRSARAKGYEVARPEIQALVPSTATRVLDIGCSSGVLGAAIKARQPADVVGIEYVEEYSLEAQDRLDRVLHGDAQELLASPEVRAGLGRFDCIIAGDVLEHLLDPWAALRHAVSMLDPGGVAIVSLPNVRFWQTFWHVGVRGRWPLRDAGLFDRTHLRWFTRRDAEDLLRSSGLEVVGVQGRYKLNYSANKVDRVLGPVLGWLPTRDFFAYQYLLVGSSPGV